MPRHRGAASRQAIAGAAAIVVLALAGCSAADVAASGMSAPPLSSGTTGAASATPIPAESDSVPADAIRLPPNPRVLIFGDSYTYGVGVSPRTYGYAYAIGDAMGWDVTVDGGPGTGYINNANGLGSYTERLAASEYGDDFDLVIVEGGTNDTKYPLAQVGRAISSTSQAFEDRFPSARFVAVGMFSWLGQSSAQKNAINRAIAKSADARGYAFLDSLDEDWFAYPEQQLLVNPRDNHPNRAGYAVLAGRMVAGLRAVTVTG